MRAVNLLPGTARAGSGRRLDSALAIGGGLAAVVVLALGAGFASAHARASSERQRLAGAQAVLGRLQAAQQARAAREKPTKPIVPVPAVTGEEQPRLAAVASALSGRIAWDRLLREFSLVVPSDITVSALSMTAPPIGAAAPPPGSGAQGFTVSGLAYSHDSVARLLARLMLVPDLTDVTLANSTANPTDGQVSFQISAAVKGAPAPPVPAAAAPAPAATTTTAGPSS